MRTARVILFYVGAVILLGALLAPWLFWLIHAHWPAIPFRRVFDRALLVVALAGLWPMLRTAGIRSWAELGYTRTPTLLRHALGGFATGLGSLWFCAVVLRQSADWKTNFTSCLAAALIIALVGLLFARAPAWWWQGVGDYVVCLILFGLYTVLRFRLTSWKTFLAGNLASALAVGIIEETFFRGGIFGVLRRGWPVWCAVVVSSVIYAGLHFCKPTEPVSINWLTGFTHLGFIFQNFGTQLNWIGLVTLMLAGVVLALVFEWTKALYFSIGLHAGWVFALKTVGAPLRDSPWVWPVLLVVLGLCWRQFGRRLT